LQFRAQRVPGRAYRASLKKDTSKRSDLYNSSAKLRLQPSTEFPDLKEYYLLEHQYAFQFLLNYKDTDMGRVVDQRINCSPDFRRVEKVISDSKGMGNVLCGYGFFLSPHVHIRLMFSSRIMPQFKLFEKQIHEFVDSLIIDRQK